jgi:hypothetical protein
MLAKMALGAELDFASAGELDSGVNRILDFMKGNDLPRPTLNTITQSFPLVSPATRVIDVGSPPSGRIWNILGFTLCAQDDATQSSAGTIGFYIGGVPASGAPSLAQLRVPRLSIPVSQTFTKGVYWCGANDSVLFNLVGLTLAGVAQFVANVFVAEWRENDILELAGR